MPVGKNSVLLQIVISKNTKVLLKRYCSAFGIPESQYCHNVIVRSLMHDFNVKEDKLCADMANTNEADV